VTVITGFPNYPTGTIYPGYRQQLWQREAINGVQVIRLPLYADHSRSAIRRALNYLSFALSATLLGPVLCGPADVLWVYHPPLTIGLPAWVIGLLRGIPFVYEIQDMWPETLAATDMLHSSVVMDLVAQMARMLYRSAAAITVISPGFRRNLIAKGVPAEKITVIPNWADEQLYRPLPYDQPLAAQYGMDGYFNVVYGGNIGAAQALETVLEVAERLRDQQQIQIVLIGDGVDAEPLRQQAIDRGLTNLRFLGRQPVERMPHFFALADALLVHLKHDPLFTITIPSKIVAYLACGRPIIAAVAGDAADIVRHARAGLICAPEDPAALARAIRVLAALPSAERERMGRASRQAFLQHYTRTTLVDQYEALFRMVAKPAAYAIAETGAAQ
jgi:glycosyltransferase involved in cell wall biosynthesis